MHEDLLGYLLGALEPEEMQRVSAWLRESPEAQAELAELERRLKPLDEGFEAIEAPSDDLLERTLISLPPGPPPSSPEEAAAIEASLPSDTRETNDPVRLASMEQANPNEVNSGRWSMLDSIGSLVSIAILLALLLPMIAEGRFESRKVACQDKLRQYGTAFLQYVNRDQQRRLPQVAPTGPEAFAGIYAIRLSDAGLLPMELNRWCPSAGLPLPRSMPEELKNHPNMVASLNSLPHVDHLHSMAVNELKQVQRFAGGHYAYTLGVVDERGYGSPRFEARTSFAVMADAPIGGALGAPGRDRLKYSHGGEGINVLYEDGAVRFVRVEAFNTMPDHPLINHNGASEAGVNIDDASLSPSWRPPFNDALQR